MQQLVPEHFLPAAEIGLRGKSAKCVVRQLVGAERRLAAPDGQHGMPLDTEPALDLPKRFRVLGLEGAPGSGKAGKLGAVDVGLRRPGEFGLSPRRLLSAWDYEIGQPQVRLDIAECCIEGLAGDTKGPRLGPELSQPCLERLVRSCGKRYAPEGQPKGNNGECAVGEPARPPARVPD